MILGNLSSETSMQKWPSWEVVIAHYALYGTIYVANRYRVVLAVVDGSRYPWLAL